MYGDLERVRLQNDQFYEAVSHRNLLSMEKLWAHSDYVRCVHPGAPLLVGWESIRESWRGLFERSIVLRASPQDAQVTVIGPTAGSAIHVSSPSTIPVSAPSGIVAPIEAT